MRYVICLSLVALTFITIGQPVFAPDGAQWVYYLPADGGPFYPETEASTSVAGDTVIDGLVAKKLTTVRSTINHWNGGTENSWTYQNYVTAIGDSILYFENDEWNFVFKLNANVGDSFVVYLGEPDDIGCVANDTIVVLEAGDTLIYGNQLQRFTFQLLVNDWFSPGILVNVYSGEFIERIGFTLGFPAENPFYCYSPIAGYFPPRFYCYSDDDITISPSFGCSEMLSVTEPEQRLVEIHQVGESIRVHHAVGSSLIVYDILGKELFQERVISDNQSFDLNHLQNGILVVVVETETSRFTRKVVKSSN